MQLIHKSLRARPVPVIFIAEMIITRKNTSNPEKGTLSREELLLLQKSAKEIQPIKENNFENIRCLLDEIDHLTNGICQNGLY